VPGSPAKSLTSTAASPPDTSLDPPSSLPNDLDQNRRVKARPLRGRSASLDTEPLVTAWQLRGGRERFSSRRSAPLSVNGFVNATRRNWPSLERRTSLGERSS
jgi:hypothetical protein